MKRLLTVAVVATLPISIAAAATARGAQPGYGHHGSQIVAVRETATFTNQIDNAPNGPSAGDTFTFTGTLVGRQNGNEQGNCTFVTATVTQCSITAFLPGGQVLFAGQLPFDQTHFPVPITGGTRLLPAHADSPTSGSPTPPARSTTSPCTSSTDPVRVPFGR